MKREACVFCDRGEFLRIATRTERVPHPDGEGGYQTRVLESEPRCLCHLQGGDGARYPIASKNHAAAERRRKAER